MASLFRLACLATLIGVAHRQRLDTSSLQDADVVLQTSRSSRSSLIRQASDSPYSHVGLVERAADGVFVIEAIEPVSRTPFERWKARGVEGRITVLRPKGLDVDERRAVVLAAKRRLGVPYDAAYRLDDRRLYCSELVTKAFADGAKRSVGALQRVDALRLSPAEVKAAAALGIAPSLQVITPASIADDDDLALVYSDFDGVASGR